MCVCVSVASKFRPHFFRSLIWCSFSRPQKAAPTASMEVPAADVQKRQRTYLKHESLLLPVVSFIAAEHRELSGVLSAFYANPSYTRPLAPLLLAELNITSLTKISATKLVKRVRRNTDLRNTILLLLHFLSQVKSFTRDTVEFFVLIVTNCGPEEKAEKWLREMLEKTMASVFDVHIREKIASTWRQYWRNRSASKFVKGFILSFRLDDVPAPNISPRAKRGNFQGPHAGDAKKHQLRPPSEAYTETRQNVQHIAAEQFSVAQQQQLLHLSNEEANECVQICGEFVLGNE